MGSIPIVRILEATERIRPHVVRTPLIQVQGAHLKLECLQKTGSFKTRGFFAAALNVPSEARQAGLMTCSAGNAAIACAYVAAALGVPCRVLMFDSAPSVKVEAVRRYGAQPVIRPRAEIFDWLAREGWREEPEHFIHPLADTDLVAGCGSLGLELLADLPSLDRIVLPAGTGGLIAGIASAVKHQRPEVEVIGVQSDGYPMWPRALEIDGRVSLEPQTIADGTAAPWSPGMHNLLRQLVDRWLLVSEPRLRASMRELVAEAKIVAEGAGALAFAALDQLEPGPITVAMVSGGNLDLALLSEILSGP